MPKISATVITFNEERDIENCLASLKRIADEIVVVDSCSTDKTKEICLSHGVVFEQIKWRGYSETKNYANNLASNDLILSMDADEILSDQMVAELQKIKENSEYDAYKFNRLTNYCGKWIKHCGWYPDTKLRLWDRRKGQWEGYIHEHVQMEEEVKVKHIKCDILHYSYHTIWQHIDQVNKFSEIGAENLFKKGKKASVFLIILKSVWKFISDYFIKLGLLDGYYGFVISSISAHATFVRYVKLKEMNKARNKKE
ncbi:glycosyltransferase family 2 protein [Flammeovirgaceae bacterium SG7u.111]|nr:glycosyltransferase family 2 protein [Flammeovirgaceae bacterium SG7u.132]WPO35804.1 glycosyltransferase family 2 protein [Flammeovirgaceae bacterium SG7u.111]